MIKARQDLHFLILTKRIDRFAVALPSDWGDGYDNINIGCTVENQALADIRLPLFLSYPIKRRFVACAPLLEAIDLKPVSLWHRPCVCQRRKRPRGAPM